MCACWDLTRTIYEQFASTMHGEENGGRGRTGEEEEEEEDNLDVIVTLDLAHYSLCKHN